MEKKILEIVAIGLFWLIAAIAVVGFVSLLSPKKVEACGWFSPCASSDTEVKKSADVQKALVDAVPIPQLQNSLERQNVSKRAQIFNTPDKISYIYLVNYGKVMAFFTVKGKVSSLKSYMVPTDKLVYGDGSRCDQTWVDSSDCYVINAPDIDGTYGENVEGIFFFTTEGAYVEWKGDYMMSDQPLKLSTQPELVRQIK